MMIASMLSPLQHLEQVSLTTMEDVFLKIGKLSEHDDSKHALTAAASRTTMEDVFLNIGELSEHDDSKHALTAAARTG